MKKTLRFLKERHLLVENNCNAILDSYDGRKPLRFNDSYKKALEYENTGKQSPGKPFWNNNNTIFIQVTRFHLKKLLSVLDLLEANVKIYA